MLEGATRWELSVIEEVEEGQVNMGGQGASDVLYCSWNNIAHKSGGGDYLVPVGVEYVRVCRLK